MEANKKIKSYEPENFEENYKAYLVDLLSTNYKTYENKGDAEKERKRIWKQLGDSETAYCDIYIDPDYKKNKDFYRHLSSFLNAASWKNKKKLYFKANEHKPDKNIDGMITVYKDPKCEDYCFTLHSDQLGFSAVPWIYFSTKYPLSRYFEMQKNKSDKDPDAIANFLTKYVYTTRTLGGSFLWPESWYKAYNMNRGNGKNDNKDNNKDNNIGYIEDRVDLTLLEIKHYFEYRELDDKKKFKYSGDILFSRYKFLDTQTWFGFFDSFEDYVDFFLFNGFVKEINKNGKKEYMPINILTGDPFEKDYLNYEKNVLKVLEEDKLKAMLDLVMRKVKTRSEDMEKLIAKYNQTNDTKGEKHENILHE